MSDLRTLRLGRLGILYLANLFFAFNSLIAVGLIYRFSDHPTTLTNIGLIFLVIEMIMLLLFPMLFGFVLPISILILTIKMWRRESKSIANLILPILMFIFLVVDWLAIYVGDLSDQWIWLKVLFFAIPFYLLTLHGISWFISYPVGYMDDK
ncbi:hypothetical protein [Lactococcus fujiensis]|uniref:hypothetical protein n=1 Tax=Lactococcus fujiensis TaxID=610251 RepID=UPI002092A565|nr:hypothetical protein [Lactococcus fujiensis]